MWGLEFLKCFVRGRQNFFYLLCVCVCGGGGGGGRGRFSTSPSVTKITDPLPINKRLVPITKSPKGNYVAYLILRYFLLSVITVPNISLDLLINGSSDFQKLTPLSYLRF